MHLNCLTNGTKIDYLFINYNTFTNYILIVYELNYFDHVLDVASQTRVTGGNRNHDPHAKSLAYYPLDYQGTEINKLSDLFNKN